MGSVPSGSVKPMPDSTKEAARSCQSTFPVLVPSWVGPQPHLSTGSLSFQPTEYSKFTLHIKLKPLGIYEKGSLKGHLQWHENG